MAFSNEIESFINDFVKDLSENNVAIFAGAGMSAASGFVDWRELLREIASELNLKIDRESDLIAVAQFSVNESGNRTKINRKILEEFTEEATPSENHKILARLPITTYWTTNYDTLIEDVLTAANKRADVKHEWKQLANTKPRRDAVVYKMHGDVNHPADAIITKQQYQSYYKDNEAFITALSGDLVSKTFLFIGFSFTDPNLEYVLGRLNVQFKEDGRQHYCFIKKPVEADYKEKEDYEYALVRQPLMINDLKRYKIKALVIDDYPVITEVLLEVERRYKKKTIFISGSAEEYGVWTRNEAQELIHKLSKAIVTANFRIINGFGWGIGSAVINGALEAISENPKRYSEDQLVLRPFPQFGTGEQTLADLWTEYRHRMISLAGIAIFVFGNKLDENGDVIDAGGVRSEFDIAIEHGLVPVPIGVTGYETQKIYQNIAKNPQSFFGDNDWIFPKIQELAVDGISSDDIVTKVVAILKKLQE